MKQGDENMNFHFKLRNLGFMAHQFDMHPLQRTMDSFNLIFVFNYLLDIKMPIKMNKDLFKNIHYHFLNVLKLLNF